MSGCGTYLLAVGLARTVRASRSPWFVGLSTERGRSDPAPAGPDRDRHRRARGRGWRCIVDVVGRAAEPSPAEPGHPNGARGHGRAVARGRGSRSPRARHRPGNRGRPARRVVQHPYGHGRNSVRRPRRERGADAAVPRRRVARAAYAADVHPRLRRAVADEARQRRGGAVRHARPDRVRGPAHVAAGRRPAAARAERPGRTAAVGIGRRRRTRRGRRRGGASRLTRSAASTPTRRPR